MIGISIRFGQIDISAFFMSHSHTHTRSPSLRHTDDASDASSPILHSSCYLLSLKIFWTAFDIRRAFHPYVECMKTCHMCISAVVRKCFVKKTYTQIERERHKPAKNTRRTYNCKHKCLHKLQSDRHYTSCACIHPPTFYKTK